MPNRIACLLALSLGCGTSTSESEADAESVVTGKEDSFRAQIPYRSMRNAAGAPRTLEFESLVLTEAEDSELPAAHFEGRYELAEQTDSGLRSSTGFFNVYRYGGENWIRFLDSSADDYTTAFAKYSWAVEGDDMVLRGHRAEGSFRMATTAATYACMYGDNPFGVDVSDALRSTPAELLLEVTPATLDAATEHFAQLGAVAGKLGLGTIEELLAEVDDETIQVYVVNYGQVEYEWLRFHQGDTQVGYIFDSGFSDPIAEVSDGDIFGCRDDGNDCDFAYPSPVADDTAGLIAPPVATLVMTIEQAADMTAMVEAQLRVGLQVLYDEDTAEMTVAELLEWVDEQRIEVYDIEGGYDWLSFYGGDNEVGIMFEAGTLVPVATVSDTDIAGCHAE